MQPVTAQRQRIVNQSLNEDDTNLVMEHSEGKLLIFDKSAKPHGQKNDWELVSTILNKDAELAASAMDELCGRYWNLIYLSIRYRGFRFHEAQDITQAVFEHIIQNNVLAHADVQKGSLRSFLLMVTKNYLSNYWTKSKTLKRGGKYQVMSFSDLGDKEKKGVHEISQIQNNDSVFEHHWALTLLQKVVQQLEQEFTKKGKLEFFKTIETALLGDPDDGIQAQWAFVLKMETGALRVALHRLRRRFGSLLRSEIELTVGNPSEVDSEIRNLLQVLTNFANT